MPRRRSLTTRQIAAAALAVIDRDGLDALTMRAVATEMGVGTMSLYRYVDSRDELERLVVGLVLGDGDPPEQDPTLPWDEQVTQLVEGMWRAIRAHPAAVPLVLARRHATSWTVRRGEATLTALAAGGFAGVDRAIAFRTLQSYVVGAVQIEHYSPLAGSGTAALAELSPALYPALAETAAHARSVPVDEEFRCGLAIVLLGLRKTVPAPRRTP